MTTMLTTRDRYVLEAEMFKQLVKLAAPPKPADPLDTLTKEDLQALERGIYGAWNAIAYDVCTAIEEDGEPPLTNKQAISVAIDADYMTSYGNGRADEVLDALTAEYDIDAIIACLSRRIRL